MRPRTLTLLALMTLPAFLVSCGGGGGEDGLVKWVKIDQAVEEAQKSGKPLMYDFTAEWCGPCHMLKRDVFADPESAGYINENYVPVMVLDRRREEGKNPPGVDDLQAQFALQGFPTLGVLSPDGSRKDRIVGYAGKEGTLNFLKAFKQAQP
jgi:thiol:disulfide interchange protein